MARTVGHKFCPYRREHRCGGSGTTLQVIGTGAVYVIDGTDISFSSLADDQPEGIVSIYAIKQGELLVHSEPSKRHDHPEPER